MVLKSNITLMTKLEDFKDLEIEHTELIKGGSVVVEEDIIP